MIEIIAHRGQWNTIDEKNSIDAIKRAFVSGFGIETDVRDYREKLVISHDIANEKSILLEDVLELYKNLKVNVTLAFNVKADGIQKKLKEILEKYDIKNYFMFDMSNPEMVLYKEQQFFYFTRHSDIEEWPVLYDDAIGVWMDSFYDFNWLNLNRIETHLSKGKKVCIVSPELHGKANETTWKMIKVLSDEKNIILCTDKPDEARSFFDE